MGDGQQSDFQKPIANDADFRTSDIPTTLFFANSAIICHRNKMKTYLKSAGNSVSSETQKCPGTQCECFTQHDTHMNTRTCVDGWKMVNRGKKRSWNSRCYGKTRCHIVRTKSCRCKYNFNELPYDCRNNDIDIDSFWIVDGGHFTPLLRSILVSFARLSLIIQCAIS